MCWTNRFCLLISRNFQVGVSILDQLPTGAPCLVMYVSKERHGLVANLTIPPDQPILEFRGKVRSQSWASK